MTSSTPGKLPGSDTVPWYRQFWPWFLIALPATVVVAALTTVVIASRGADDLVVDEYYKNGLAINRQLEKQQRAAQLGISATLAIEGQGVIAQLTGPVADTQLDLLLSHPLEADRDISLPLRRTAPGVYAADAALSGSARWHWTLRNTRPPLWRLDGSVVPEPPRDAPAR
jgi:hypothetical protein